MSQQSEAISRRSRHSSVEVSLGLDPHCLGLSWKAPEAPRSRDGALSIENNALCRETGGGPSESEKPHSHQPHERDGRRRFYLAILIGCTWFDFPISPLFLFCTRYCSIFRCNARSFDSESSGVPCTLPHSAMAATGCKQTAALLPSRCILPSDARAASQAIQRGPDVFRSAQPQA